MSTGDLQPERLRQFRPFEALDTHQLLLLKSHMQWVRVPSGHTLFEFGDIDSIEFFLLEGEVELSSEDGITHQVSKEHPSARRQLARLRPRQFTATTISACELVSIDADILESLQDDSGSVDATESDYGVSEVSSMEEMESQELLNGFRSALQRNQFVLPSLPEVALKVRHLLEQENTSADQVAAAVSADPAIAAKLIRAANSPVYHGAAPCDTTRNAIVRLGLETTRQLVVSFAVRDLFSSGSARLQRYMLKTWRQSVEVAAISFVIARMIKAKSVPAEEAMLGGLVHDLGVIAVLAYLDSKGTEHSDEQLDVIVEKLRADVGEMILQRWKFPQELIVATKFATDWQRVHPFSADLCDVVQVARLHNYIRNKRPMPVQRIDEVPAFHKLALGDLTPELTIHILDEAKEQIAEIKAVLNA